MGILQDGGRLVLFNAGRLGWTRGLSSGGRIVLPNAGSRLLIHVGTPGKYVSMCIRSNHAEFDKAYEENRG